MAQPPFFELESLVFMPPGADVITKIEMSGPHEYVLSGLDAARDVATRLGVVDVCG